VTVVQKVYSTGAGAKGQASTKVLSTWNGSWTQLALRGTVGQDDKSLAPEDDMMLRFIVGPTAAGPWECPRGGTVLRAKLHLHSAQAAAAIVNAYVRVGIMERDGKWDVNSGFRTVEYPLSKDLPHMTDENSDAIIPGRVRGDVGIGFFTYNSFIQSNSLSPVFPHGWEQVGVWAIGDGDYSPNIVLQATPDGATLPNALAAALNELRRDFADAQVGIILDGYGLPANGEPRICYFHTQTAGKTWPKLYVEYDNGAPTVTSTPPTEAFVGIPVLYTVVLVDPPSLPVPVPDPVLYLAPLAVPLTVNAPAVNGSSGAWTWLPDASELGQTFQFTVGGADMDGLFGIQLFSLTVRKAWTGAVRAESANMQAVAASSEDLRAVAATGADRQAVAAEGRTERAVAASSEDRRAVQAISSRSTPEGE